MKRLFNVKYFDGKRWVVCTSKALDVRVSEVKKDKNTPDDLYKQTKRRKNDK